MLFNSYVFLFFGVVVFAAYFALSNWRARKLFLLAMSYIFYGAWNAPYLLLIIFSTVLDFFTAPENGSAGNKEAACTLPCA